MANCDIIPLATKACSGKCMGGACGNKPPRTWVVAACEGMISLFEKQADGHITLLPQNDSSVFSSMETFQSTLKMADENRSLDQLVIVGGRNDIAWMHAALPSPIAKHIAAEIEYPLMAGWFKQQEGIRTLTLALENVFQKGTD